MNDERRRPTKHELALRVQAKGLDDLLTTSKVFRRFVFTTLDQAGIFATTYRQGSPDATSYLEGRRSLGLLILDSLRLARPDILAIMEREGDLLRRLTPDQPQENPDEDQPFTDDDP